MATIAGIPNGAVIKFSDRPEVYLVDNGQLRHFTTEVKTASGQSIFNYMVVLDPSFRNQFSGTGASISGNIPFDPPKFTAPQPTTTTPQFTRQQLQDIFASAQSLKNYSGLIQNQGDIDFLLQKLSGSDAATYAQRIQEEINRQAQTKQERSVPKFNSTGTSKYNWSTGGWEDYTPSAGQVFDPNTKQWVQAPSTALPPSAGGGGGTPAGRRIVYVWDGAKHNIYAVDEYNNYDYISDYKVQLPQKIKEGFTDTGNPGAGKSSTNLPTQLQTAIQQQTSLQTPPISQIPSPTVPPVQAQATLTSPDGKYKTVVNVGSAEASQLQSRGWILGATGQQTFSAIDALKIQIPGVAGAASGMATLTSPDGNYKVAVPIGSNESNQLTNAGWTVGSTGKTIMNIQQALGSLSGEKVQTPIETARETMDLLSPSEFEYLISKGLTEADITRVGSKIYLTDALEGKLAISLRSFRVRMSPEEISKFEKTWGFPFTPIGQGGVIRNLAAEQEFVKNWGGRYGRLPTPEEVNQGVYGTSNPQFTTPQGTPPSGVAGQAEKQEPSPQLVLSINSIYKKYFNRDAKPDELAFWATRQLDELDRYLAIEYQTASGHSYDGSPITPGNLKSDKDLSYDEDTKRALSLIDDQVKAGTIPADIAQLFKAVIANYPKDAGFNTTELLNTFNKIKTETIDPHFKELTDLAIRDIQDTTTYFKEQERITLESEEASAAERIRQEQAGLEASGMTFTGEGIKQLGYGGLSKVGSAYAGTGIEGAIPQYNRLLAQSSAAERQKQYSQLGLQAESKLGTAGIAGLALPSYRVLGGITGGIQEQKEQDYGAALRNLISTTSLRNQGYSTQNLFS